MKLLKRTGAFRLLALLLLCIAAMRYIPSYFERSERPELYSAQLADAVPAEAPEGTKAIHLTGASLYRINRLYLNGRKTPIRYITTLNYSEALVCVDADLLDDKAEISVGKSFFLTAGEAFRSNKVTLR